MKKILITGANSYIGTSFEKYMQQYADEYQVDTIDMIDGSWREKSFSGYDIIYHVAGIAHQKETKKNAGLYYQINKDLAIEVAQKAKKEGVSQFVFLSSMSVYGKDTGGITEVTQPAPKSNYGKSKLQAEKGLESLSSDNFIVSILRPPMVYGKGCKGNFQSVVKLVKKLPVFPKVNNKRSMIYIENLSKYVKWVIEQRRSGLIFPCNREVGNTSQMALSIARALNKRLYLSRLLAFLVKILSAVNVSAKKAFGSLFYEVQDKYFVEDLISFEDSMRESV